LLDTTKWAKEEGTSNPMVKFYHSHPSYDNFPVVTVTYESAVNYCKWLTGINNSDPKRKFKKVIFRLPSEEEWVYAATAGKIDRFYFLGWQPAKE
jgi:formylglycine-generating enzyme required for sulfatase activity